MEKKAICLLGFIAIAIVVHTKATSQVFCHGAGDRWLENPTTICICSNNNKATCSKLNEPACMDIRGNFRRNFETWMNDSCVECACVNGSINCTLYNVNITYGLYTVKLSQTCERCHIPSRSPKALSTCEAYRKISARESLFRCAHGNVYIRDIHRCNGIQECPDASDERGCDNVTCKDEEGDTYLIKNDDGWSVSRCLRCRCKKGLMECHRSLRINFPGYQYNIYIHEENCTQPLCNVKKYLSTKGECEGAEFTKNGGIVFEGQSWRHGECTFYFPGAYEGPDVHVCPAMARPVCYVYNGAVCCATQCSGLQQVANQTRGDLTLCPGGRQLTSGQLPCKGSNHCLRNFDIQNCSSEVTCMDEESNHYFEGATWRVGGCMTCTCNQGKIYCSRKIKLVSFSQFNHQLRLDWDYTFTEHCNQTECNVANFMKRNVGVCTACSWNGKLYYDGDRWKENGVDFYCSSASQKVRHGCYVKSSHVICTGAIPEIRNLSLISNEELFLCESGYEIRSLGDRCNVYPNCGDHSDEWNCDHYYCPSKMSYGFLWTRSRVNREIVKQCFLVNPEWTGTFSRKCVRSSSYIYWERITCHCEKRTLVENLNQKVSGVNESNFIAVLKELANYGKERYFANPKVFHDYLKDLFNVTTGLLMPLTEENASTALQYCQRFIDTVLHSPVYKQDPLFCGPVVDWKRNALVKKAFEFLRLAPRNTTAYRVGLWQNFSRVKDNNSVPLENFKSDPVVTYKLVRWEMNLEINTSPMLPAITVVKEPPENNNLTKENDTSLNETNTTNLNETDDLTDQEKNENLGTNCTAVTYDEEKRVFIYTPPVSQESIKHHKIRSRMELVLLCISIAAIVLALILLTFLRLKKTARIFIHKNLLLSLGLGNLVFVLDKTLFVTRKEHSALCSAVAVVQFFFHTALFTWMFAEGINLYIKLVKIFTSPWRYVTYMAVGWGIPAITVGLVAAVRPSAFDMGRAIYVDINCGSMNRLAEVERTRCWFNGSLWIYKGPILAILAVNLVLFVILLRVVFSKIASTSRNDRLKATRRSARSVVVLLPLLGVTWILGFFVEFHFVLEYVFVSLNSTQGVMFFIFHCVCDDKVQQAVRKLGNKPKDANMAAKPAQAVKEHAGGDIHAAPDERRECRDDTQPKESESFI